MKLILLDFSSDLHCGIAKKLVESNHDIVYWVCKDYLVREQDNFEDYFPQTIMHNYFDALINTPPSGYALPQGEGVPKDVVREMQAYEAQILDMMEKLDNTNMPLMKKRELFYGYIEYWYGVCTKEQPEAIIFADVPHIVYNTTVYFLAKVIGIKTLVLKRTSPIIDRVLVFEDIYNQHELRLEYQKLLEVGSKHLQIDQAVNDFYQSFEDKKRGQVDEKYKRYTGQSGKERAVEIFPQTDRILKNLIQHKFLATVRNYLNLLMKKERILGLETTYATGWQQKFKNIKYKKIRESFKREYVSLQNNNLDLAKPFVYFPLHRIPEGSVNPMGGKYASQIDIIKKLSKTIPDSWSIYVKEHPTQWNFPLAHTGRYKGYYKKINNLKNVELVPMSISGFNLISKSMAVATVTGTAAMEGLFLNKPAIIFGFPTFMDCEGIIKVEDSHECKLALDKIACGYVPDSDKVKLFLQAVENVAAKAFIHSRHGICSEYTLEDSINNISDKIIERLKS